MSLGGGDNVAVDPKAASSAFQQYLIAGLFEWSSFVRASVDLDPIRVEECGGPGINRCLEHLQALGDARMKIVPPLTRKQSDAQKCLARPPEHGRVQARQSRPASPELRA